MQKLDLQTLESWLWESANILRGSIDSSDFKNYIFGILFLKRFNDVFEENLQKIIEDENISKDEALDDLPNSQIVPEDANWDNIVKKTENIGEALDKAFLTIEEHNTTLENVLTSTQFGDKNKLSDDVLSRLLRHFNKYKLDNASLYKEDLLGDAYEYMIKMFADDAGKKGGEFYTPKGVVKLLVDLIDPKPGMSIYDPTEGSGGMLLESAKHIKLQKNGTLAGGVPNCHLAGQEKNQGTWAIAKLNLYLHNIDSSHIKRGDTLSNPQHIENGSLETFDRVIANPPFSAGKWWGPAENNLETKIDKDGKEKEVSPNYKKVVNDPFGRLQLGIPPRGYADLAFLQHMLASLKDDGKMGVVLPHGVLFRGGEEGKIRQNLITEHDWLEAVVGLPAGLFYNTGIPASVIILNKNKPVELKHKVVIIDASSEYKEGKNQNELEPKNIAKIVESYNNKQNIDKYMRVVDYSEIKENDYNLNIARYIDTSEPEVIVDIPSVRQTIEELEEKEKEIDAKLSTYLQELGL